ncbi:MAG: cyclic nucleotide-binding domain-containing protein, partial [Proteobacteria bacterium]|nr:cyclic nucleotide-binding domain-containing protein [Pseudomonadota bacterium]
AWPAANHSTRAESTRSPENPHAQEEGGYVLNDSKRIMIAALGSVLILFAWNEFGMPKKARTAPAATTQAAPDASGKTPDAAKATAAPVAASAEASKAGEIPAGTAVPGVPLFSDLNQEELVRIMGGLKRVKYNQGDWMIREGEKGDTIYIISSGKVAIYKKVKGEDLKISDLEEGEFFGEFSFFMSHQRQASVRAEGEVELLEIKREELDKIVEEYPNVSDILVKFYKDRVLDTVIAISPLFRGLGSKQRKELTGKFELKVFEKGQAVIQEGEKGDSLFLIKDGDFSVSTAGPGGQAVVLATLQSGDFFGEIALISDQPRTATVTALTRGRLMVLSRTNFMELAGRFPQALEVARTYLQQRAEDTVSTIMTLDDGGSGEVVV